MQIKLTHLRLFCEDSTEYGATSAVWISSVPSDLAEYNTTHDASPTYLQVLLAMSVSCIQPTICMNVSQVALSVH